MEETTIIKRLLQKVKDDENCLEFLESLIVKINQLSYENKLLRQRLEKIMKFPENQKRVRFEK